MGRKKASRRDTKIDSVKDVNPRIDRILELCDSDDPVVSRRATILKESILTIFKGEQLKIDELLAQSKAHVQKMEELPQQLPSRVQNLTMDDIINAGGLFDVTEDHTIIRIPTSLYKEGGGDIGKSNSQSNFMSKLNQSAKKVAASQRVIQALNMSGNQRSLRASVKRVRSVAHTPSSAKKVTKIKKIDQSPMSTGYYTARTTRATSRLQQTAFGQPATTASRNTRQKKVMSQLHSTVIDYSTISSKSGDSRTEMPPPASTKVVKTPKNSADNAEELADEINNLSLVNPKTPGGNRLFKKPPRKPLPNESVVVASKFGTPLIVDHNKLKPALLTEEQTKLLSEQSEIDLVE